MNCDKLVGERNGRKLFQFSRLERFSEARKKPQPSISGTRRAWSCALAAPQRLCKTSDRTAAEVRQGWRKLSLRGLNPPRTPGPQVGQGAEEPPDPGYHGEETQRSTKEHFERVIFFKRVYGQCFIHITLKYVQHFA